MSVEDTAKTADIDKSVVEKILQLNANSQHKRLEAQKPFKD